ncbi:Staphylococcal nuclease (SNase-like) [Theobroma cacao]|nr:Staphylococcal nuclease (SNase-like) [Theobroma cacao]
MTSTVPRLLQPLGVPRLAKGVLFKIAYISDGDGVNVPKDVFLATVEISKARVRRSFDKKISQVGYQLINHENKEILTRKHQLRLRGIDTPKNDMHGKEAKKEVIKLVRGKQLMVLVYDMDHYGRYMADVCCHDTLVEEVTLKKGPT